MAFEYKGYCFRPSSQLLLQIWQTVMDACTAGGISLDGPISWPDLTCFLEKEHVSDGLLFAVVEAVSCGPRTIQTTGSARSMFDTWQLFGLTVILAFKLDRMKLFAWIKTLVLEGKHDSNSLNDTDNTLQSVYEYLPEKWRNTQSMQTLTVRKCTSQLIQMVLINLSEYADKCFIRQSWTLFQFTIKQ